MGEERKPKYSIGERVYIEKEGRVAAVCARYLINNQWYYALESRNDLYSEKGLSKPGKDSGQGEIRENLVIEYKFQFGDIVKVKGYGQDLFTVIGFRAEIWRYQDSAWEDIIYELSRLRDGQWLEASEEEITFITNEERGKKFFLKKDKGYDSGAPFRIGAKKGEKTKKETADIDELLDIYNDYYYLYLNFGEASYKKKMNEIMKKLKALANHPFNGKQSSHEN
jgi:hypothetical protein